VSNGRKLKIGERLDVRQVRPVKIDVMNCYQKNNRSNLSNAGCADYKANGPTPPAWVGAAKLPGCLEGARAHSLEPGQSTRLKALRGRD
jgi:hypothetical protein